MKKNIYPKSKVNMILKREPNTFLKKEWKLGINKFSVLLFVFFWLIRSCFLQRTNLTVELFKFGSPYFLFETADLQAMASHSIPLYKYKETTIKILEPNGFDRNCQKFANSDSELHRVHYLCSRRSSFIIVLLVPGHCAMRYVNLKTNLTK